MSKVILVTGAGRGLGTDITREALAAGHQVVATGRRPDEVEKTMGGPRDDLLVTTLDVTSLEDAEAAAQAAEAKARELLAQADASRELGGSLDFDDVHA
jgi:NAD(P)-dependent dehydrogenase (short-subunit alcohol dehydrogenase family)